MSTPQLCKHGFPLHEIAHCNGCQEERESSLPKNLIGVHWRGRPVKDLSLEELIQALSECFSMLDRMKESASRFAALRDQVRANHKLP